MTIDKQKLQKLLWADVAAWKAGCDGWKVHSDALGGFLGDKTVEEVALELLAENERLVPFEEAYATACNVRNRLIKENEALRKDAERYRFLRDKQTFIWLIQDWFPSSAEFSDVDAEIDVAMGSAVQL